MADVVLLAESTDTLSVCDMHTGGKLNQPLRGGVGAVPCRGVARLGHDYVISAYKEKPVLHVWTWSRHAQPALRIPLPGKALALACSPCGTFCLCGIGSSIYIWEVASGRLLSVLSHHFQAVSVLRFTDDGSHFLSGGHDGHVYAWNLSGVLSQCHRGEVPSPFRSWRHHSRPVTDIHCGSAGLHARVFTTSKDGTCQVYELGADVHLCSIIFESSVLAIALDLAEYHMFGAEETGNVIRKIAMYKMTSTGPQKAKADSPDEAEDTKKQAKMVCTGHSGAINCLSMSFNGTILLSASADGTARLWQVNTCECLQVIERSGPLYFACFTPLPPAMLQRQPGMRVKPEHLAPLALFQRQLTTSAATSSSVSALEHCYLRLSGQVQGIPELALQGSKRRDYWKSFLHNCAKVDERNKREAGNTEAIKSNPLVKSLKQQLAELQKVNRRLLKEEAQDALSMLQDHVVK